MVVLLWLCLCLANTQVKLSSETVVKRGLVSEKVKATDIVKEHQIYCDTEREIKHFPAESLAYVTPVSKITCSDLPCFYDASKLI